MPTKTLAYARIERAIKELYAVARHLQTPASLEMYIRKRVEQIERDIARLRNADGENS